MAPGRTRQGGSLGRPRNVFLGAVTEGPAQQTCYHEAGIAPVASVKDRLNLPLFHPPFQDKSGCEIWEQFGNNPGPHHRNQAILHTASEGVLGRAATLATAWENGHRAR